MRYPRTLLAVLLSSALVSCGSGEVTQPVPAGAVAASTATPSATSPEVAHPRAVVLGDSYTEGVGSSGPGYVDLVGERMGWTVVGQGQGGTGYVSAGSTPGFAPYGARVSAVVSQAPDIVVVQGSTNDVGQPATAVHEAAVNVLTALREQLPGARVVVVGPLAPPVVDPAGVVGIRDALADAAARVGVPFIDPIAGGWLQPPADLYPDGLHPGDQGYRLMAARLTEALEERGF